MKWLGLAAAAAAFLGGCGLGKGGEQPAGVSVTVSRDFGTQPVGSGGAARIAAGETVMRLLARGFDVETRYGGGFVQSINGVAGGRRAGRQVDWFFYVNGIEAEQGATARELERGDRVWWDHHEWGATMRVPAVVGSFPEPFLSGVAGKRLPVTLGCAEGSQDPCEEVERRLERVGVTKAAKSLAAGTSGPEVLRILVGRWSDIRRDPAAQQIERGPRASGVFARFDRAGTRLELLDQRGAPARTARAGAGLVAATRYQAQQPTWVVTGTDAAGVAAAAAQLSESALRRRFALAVEQGRGAALPVVAPAEAP